KKTFLFVMCLYSCLAASKAQIVTLPPIQNNICRGESVNLSVNSFSDYVPINLMNNVNQNTYTYNPPTGNITYLGVPFFILASPNETWDAFVAGQSSPNPNAQQSTTIQLLCPVRVDSIFTLMNTHAGQTTTG